MKIKLLLLLPSILFSHSYAMQPPADNSKKKLEVAVTLLPLDLCTFLQQSFCSINVLSQQYSCPDDAARMINVLVRTNKFLYMLIDNDDFILNWIKELSSRFDCSNMDVAETCCTRAIKNRYLMQMPFSTRCPRGYENKYLYNLKQMGLDLEFTYDKNKQTVLQMNIGFPEFSFVQAGKWMIENGADINVIDNRGCNVAMIATCADNTTLLELLLNHKALNIHHQDNKGNTLLHYSIHMFAGIGAHWEIDEKSSAFMFEMTKQLLEKGANPTVKNKEGKTPLNFAYEIGSQSHIDPLKKAVLYFTKK
jgi:hypothetical protein